MPLLVLLALQVRITKYENSEVISSRASPTKNVSFLFSYTIMAQLSIHTSKKSWSFSKNCFMFCSNRVVALSKLTWPKICNRRVPAASSIGMVYLPFESRTACEIFAYPTKCSSTAGTGYSDGVLTFSHSSTFHDFSILWSEQIAEWSLGCPTQP